MSGSSTLLKKHLMTVAMGWGLGSACAGTAVWTGGSGDWSNVANWRDGALPQTGDTVYVSNTVAEITINVDAADVSLASIRLEGAESVKLTGNALTLTGGFKSATVSGVTNVMDFPNCIAGFLSLVNAECDVPLVFAPSSGNCGISVADKTVDFKKRIDCSGTGYFYVHSGSLQNVLGTLNFHDEVSAPQAAFRALQHPTGIAHFYAPVTFRTFDNIGWSREEVYFHAAGNVFPKLMLDYGNKTLACVAGAYPSNLIVGLGNTDISGDNAGIFNLGNFDTTIDRLGEDVANAADGTYLYDGQAKRCGMVRSTANIDGGGATKPVTLTMNATANAQTTMMVMDAVSLVWNPSDDFTLTTLGRAHQTTGSIDVRRGTLRMTGACTFARVPTITLGAGAKLVQASTLANALAGLETLTLGDGARVEFTAAVETCAKAVVTLGADAKLVLPAGTELHVAAVCANGAYLANGDHAGETWIEGEGKVVIEPGTIAFWKSGVDGNWSDATKWAGGSVPDATCTRVCLTVPSASDYVVTVDQPVDAFKGDLLVGNAAGGLATLRLAADLTVTQSTVTVSKGGLIDVPTGTTFTYFGPEVQYSGGYPSNADKNYPSEVRSDIVIRDGGEWRTSGGATVITNFCGKFQVSGASQESVGKFTMTSGTVLFMNIASAFPLTVLPNGRVDFTGGLFRPLHNGYNHQTDLANRGGVFRFKDTEVNTDGKFFHSVGGSIVMGTGETRFEGTAVLKITGGKSLMPSGPGETATLTFADGAQLPNHNLNSPYIACGNEGRAVINWNSGDSVKNNYFVIGANRGYGELNVNSGTLRAHSLGFKVGAYDVGTSSLNNIFGTAFGQVTVKAGATLEIAGSLNKGWNAATKFSGLVVGEGMGDGLAHSDARYVYEGRLDVFGTLGINTGNSAIGLGRAKGTFVVDGGTATFQKGTDCEYSGQTVVGMGGGYGRVVVSNGVFETKNGNLYVGGCLTSDLAVYENISAHPLVTWGGDATYPADLRDADGKVSVVKGSVKVQNATVLGKDGVGAIEMVGSSGSFTTKDLELCAGKATLRYVADLSGVAPVKVTGSLTIGEGAAIAVDARSLAGRRRRFKVLDTDGATVTGAFSFANLTVLGVEPHEQVVLRAADDGVYVAVSGGGVFILR